MAGAGVTVRSLDGLRCFGRCIVRVRTKLSSRRRNAKEGFGRYFPALLSHHLSLPPNQTQSSSGLETTLLWTARKSGMYASQSMSVSAWMPDCRS